MNCPSCNATMPDGARFCTQCGTDMTDPGSGPRTPGGSQPEQTLPTGVGGPNLHEQLKAALGDRYEIQELGDADLKGKRERVPVYRVWGPAKQANGSGSEAR